MGGNDWKGSVSRLRRMRLHRAERHRQGKTDLGWSSSSPERPDESALSRTQLLPYLVNTARHRRPREETPVLDQPRGPDAVLRMAPEDVCRVVEPAGFALSAVVDVGPYHYGAVFRRAESI